jgi:hypothetical protein
MRISYVGDRDVILKALPSMFYTTCVQRVFSAEVLPKWYFRIRNECNWLRKGEYAALFDNTF